MSNSGPTFFPLSDLPDRVEVELQIAKTGQTIKNWKSYSFNSHFLTPSDGWHFEASGPQADLVAQSLLLGNQVSLVIAGNVQATGYIEEIEQGGDASSGTTVHVSGRDLLGPMVDSSADQTLRLGQSATLADLIDGVAGPYGWSNAMGNVLVDNGDNVATQSGVYGAKSRKGKKSKKPSSFTLHLTKPFAHEGAFAFLARVCQRQALWPWLSADGTQLIVSTPNFDQDPMFSLKRSATPGGDTQNNILHATAKRSIADQPSLIIAEGSSGGGEFGRSKIRAIVTNPAVSGAIGDIIAKYPDAVQTDLGVTLSETYFSQPPKPMYLHDEDAKTQDELAAFVRRELALKMHKSFEYRCIVEGHTQAGAPWCVDAMVDVQDDLANVHESLYILERTFEKNPQGGTVTHLTCIRSGSLQF